MKHKFTTHTAAMLVAVLLMIPVLSIPSSAADLPVNIRGYATGVHDMELKRLFVYYDSALSDRNPNEYIDVLSDELRVLSIDWDHSSILLRYPVGNGKKTKDRWAPMEALFPSSDPNHVQEVICSKKITTYFNLDLTKRYGSISAGDRAYLWQSNRNDSACVIYELDAGGYKLAWIPVSEKEFFIPANTNSAPSGNQAISLSVPAFLQTDSRWGNTYIGNKTISSIGCLLTSMSMKHSYQTGNIIYPNDMKKLLHFQNNDLVWSSVTQLGYRHTRYGKTLSQDILSAVSQALKENRPVVLGGKKYSGGQHWIVIYGCDTPENPSADSLRIHDPNGRHTTLAQFLNVYPIIQGTVI